MSASCVVKLRKIVSDKNLFMIFLIAFILPFRRTRCGQYGCRWVEKVFARTCHETYYTYGRERKQKRLAVITRRQVLEIRKLSTQLGWLGNSEKINETTAVYAQDE